MQKFAERNVNLLYGRISASVRAEKCQNENFEIFLKILKKVLTNNLFVI